MEATPDEPVSPETTASRHVILRVLGTESFIERLLLLIITVVISGAILPLAIKYMDTMPRANQQRVGIPMGQISVSRIGGRRKQAEVRDVLML